MNDAMAMNCVLSENRKEDGDNGVERPEISLERNINL